MNYLVYITNVWKIGCKNKKTLGKINKVIKVLKRRFHALVNKND